MPARSAPTNISSPVAPPRRWFLALIPPLVVFLLQWAAWDQIRPYAWFLFYPAIFASSWIGGIRGGLAATGLSVALIWWFFIPPEHSLAKEPRLLFPATVYVLTCTLIAAFHDRLYKLTARLRQANADRRLFEALIENSSDFIGIADPSGTPVYVNPAGRRLVGLRDDTPIQDTRIPDYYPPDHRAFAADVIVKAMREQGHWEGETYFRNWETNAAIPVSDTHFIIREPSTGATLGMGTVTRDISELERARAQTEESSQRLREANAEVTRLYDRSKDAQERFELALRGADLATWDWNIASGDVTFNSRWAELRGYSADELRPRVDTWIEGIHPDDWPHVKQALDDYLAGRVAEYEAELRVRTKAGAWIWILDRGKIFARDERGQPVRMVGTELDITPRKRAEEELRLAHAVSSGILAVSADAIICVDDDQRIATFNEGAEKIFGHARDDAIGATLETLIPERFRSKHQALVGRFAGGPEVARKMGERRTEILGLRKDGSEFPADVAISKLEVGGKRILTATIRDISHQKRVEHEQTFLADIGLVLATSLDYDDTLTRIAELAVRDVADICIVDVVVEQGNIHRTHAVCRDPARAWIGDWFMRIALDRSKPTLTASAMALGRSVLIDRVSDSVIAAIAQTEEHLQLLRAAEIKSMMTVPLTAHGRLAGVIGLISSSPERVYGPDDLRLAEELGQRAAFAIENARLYGLARRAIRAREDVLGIVAHDLRNPLNTINIYAQMFAEYEEPRERKAGEAIHRAALRMNRLIQDLLDVARMDSGRLTVEQSGVPARDVVAGVVDAQHPLATSAGLELELELAPDLPDLWADRDRLVQIFENLIGNALKFTQHGTISVGAAPRDREVLFWVRDTGSGIPAVELPHLFDRFWQGRKEKRKGAGLGLAIVKGLVEAHGGHIWVESTVGEGSCFYFTIPTAPMAEERPSAMSHAP